jgi:chromosome segregation ATPase
MRVDPPHSVTDELIGGVGSEAAPANGSDAPAEAADAAQAAIVLEQVRSQASQLATHLRKQQASIDHREAELNARFSAFDNQVRGARLWLTERQQDIAVQQAALETQRQAVAAREKQMAAAAGSSDGAQYAALAELRQLTLDLEARDNALIARLAELNKAGTQQAQSFETCRNELAEARRALEERHEELDARRREFDRRQAARDEELRQAAAEIALGRQARQLQEATDKLQAREQHLDDAERMLTEQQAQIDDERLWLEDERASLGREVHAERRKLADDRREADGELEKERQKLRRRQEDLEARQTALQQLRSDLAHTQRDTLEMRLATEELWARLCGAMAPAALTQSLSELRLKLADQQRLALEELATQRADFEELSKRVSTQHAALIEQKRELQSWIKRREEEIQQQAARLAGRERTLDEQESEFKRHATEWKKERQGYEREIRRLLGQLRRQEVAA